MSQAFLSHDSPRNIRLPQIISYQLGKVKLKNSYFQQQQEHNVTRKHIRKPCKVLTKKFYKTLLKDTKRCEKMKRYTMLMSYKAVIIEKLIYNSIQL